jgi:hypothetical protein
MKIKCKHSLIAVVSGIIFTSTGALVKISTLEFDLGSIKVNGSMLLKKGAIIL